VGALLLGGGVLSGGCAAHPEEAALLEVFDATVDALRRSDFDALWELTAEDSRLEVVGLLRDLHASLLLVPKVYGEADAATARAARDALGEPLIEAVFPEDPAAGPRFLARLMEPDRLRFDQHALDGLMSRSVTVDDHARPPRGVVRTSAGESLAFVKTDGQWRSLLVRDLFLESRVVRGLREHAARMLTASVEVDARWRRSRDPGQPQGAYNLLRDAARDGARDGPMLYNLMAEDARAVVLLALERAREAQRDIQRRTTRRQRPRAYEQTGLAMFVEARSDRELFMRWVRSEGFRSPVRVDDEPASVEVADEDLATVVTDGGARLDFSRGDDGLWRLAGQARLLEEALLEPIDALLGR